jgi:Transcription termination factor nusG
MDFDVETNQNSLAQGERCYVVHVLPHRERQDLQLEVHGFRTFLPRRRKSVRHARKFTTVSARFFPPYLFVALDLRRDRWRGVNGIFRVETLVVGEENPLPCWSGRGFEGGLQRRRASAAGQCAQTGGRSACARRTVCNADRRDCSHRRERTGAAAAARRKGAGPYWL